MVHRTKSRKIIVDFVRGKSAVRGPWPLGRQTQHSEQIVVLRGLR